MNCNSLRYLLIFAGTICSLCSAYGQQNRNLYLQHEVPQSSLLNPAVPLSCGWTIGLPVLSSVHVNLGSNFASFNQLFTHSGNNVYTSTFYDAEKYFRHNNFVSTEAHVQLLGLGYSGRNWSVMGTVVEKNGTLTNMPGDLFSLILHGNSQFVGQTASLSRLSAFGSHYTELGLSFSKDVHEKWRWGVRGKLLFGKANISTLRSDLTLSPHINTYDLAIEGDMEVRTSMPAWWQISNNRPDGFVRDESVGIADLLTELGNPGVAFDLGVIVPLTERTEVSASVVDVGFITWKKNIHNYTASGRFLYTGPFNDGTDTENYFTELGNALADSLHLSPNNDPYTTFLPSKFAVGIHHFVSPTISLGGTADLQLYRTKLVTGINANLMYEPISNVKGIVSWAYQYNTIKNVGLGVVLGRHPVQFFAMSDNVLGFVAPLGARNFNFRAGLNIMPGCKGTVREEALKKKKFSSGSLQGTCGWERQQPKKKRR